MTTKTSMKQACKIYLRACKEISRHLPSWIPAIGMQAILESLSPYLTIYFSAQLINELAGQRNVRQLVVWVMLIMGVSGILGLLKALCQSWANTQKELFYEHVQAIYTQKFMDMDYSVADSQKTRDLFHQIQENANWMRWGYEKNISITEKLFQGLSGLVGALILAWGLFVSPVPESGGSLMILNHPLVSVGIVILLVGMSGLGSKMINVAFSFMSKNIGEETLLANRIFHHFTDMGLGNHYEMDYRIYPPYALFHAYMKQVGESGLFKHLKRISRGKMGLYDAIGQAIPAVFSCVVYAYVCLKALGGAFGIGSITQYVSAISSVADHFTRILQGFGEMKNNTAYMQQIHQFLDLEHVMYQGSLTTEKRNDGQYEIVFKDVSFHYPGTDKWALRHVNATFKIGGRLAVVGENGSGKSTFIKLLCRLYDPQEGVITLNGIDIRKYRYDQYMDLFSVVFQDFQLLSQPLKNNVAASVQVDETSVIDCLNRAGFEKYRHWDEGISTYLYHDFGQNGVDVSGGEAQKIAIARALYKDAPFIILDEPTASLDPVAEAEIYHHFNTIVEDKTAIFISHRLSSCKFCDTILVFREGEIVQTGSHEKLVKQKEGAYYDLWHAQAQYYETID